MTTRILMLALLMGCDEAAPPAPASAAPSSSTVPAASSVAVASSASAAASASSTAGGASSKTPTRLHIPRDEAKAAGLPDVGLALDGIWSGFTANLRPQGGTFLTLGASPPSGPVWIQFVIRSYQGADATEADIARMFRSWGARLPDGDKLVQGERTTLQVAGASRVAVPFLLGSEEPQRGAWCVVLVPSPRAPREGLMVMMGIAADAASRADCVPIASHEHFLPLVGSLRVE